MTADAANLAEVNTAYADVLVREDLFARKAFLVGQVASGWGKRADGIAGIRVLLEDGSYTITDRDGRYHFEDVQPGTHVVQLDPTSIPKGFKAQPCQLNSRNSGDFGGRFTEVRAGTMWQENFRLVPARQHDTWTTQLHARAIDDRVHYRLEIVMGETAASHGSALVQLSENAELVQESTRFNGLTVKPPRKLGGALSFALPEMSSRGKHRLEFEVFVTDPNTPVSAKASASLTTALGKKRAKAVTSVIESLPGDERLYVIAEGAILDASIAQPPLPPDTNGAVLSRAYEPVDRGRAQASSVSSVTLELPAEQLNKLPYELPEIKETTMPEFGRAWLASAETEPALVWPPEDFNPRTPAVNVVVSHPVSLRPHLVVDGELVSAVAFDGSVSDVDRGVALTRWQNVPISERDSQIDVQLLDEQGALRTRLTRGVHFGQRPVRAELVEEKSYLVADGVHPPMLAVRLFDRAGYPARPGLSGEFAVQSPYRALDEAKNLEVVDRGGRLDTYQIRQDGIAYVQLEPTTTAGEVALTFQFDRHRAETLRARLAPGVRDWVLVGLVESAVNFNVNSSDHGVGPEEGVVHDGRAAFYAKGMVRGDWLLTASYDTDKERQDTIRRAIDPNRFYTLYGDGTEQHYDAQSQRKLYVKLERRDIEVELGDYNTGFTRSELARYDRTLGGARAGYFGDKVQWQAFASDTNQSSVFDTLPGDGTSGVYRLSSQRVLSNSEQVRVLTRDRFRSERILEEATLTRHLDYTIDYDAGQIIFKQPVLSQDASFNPITIEVRYEVADAGRANELVTGTRLAYKLDSRDSEIGLTYVRDDVDVNAGTMTGIDAHYRFGEFGELDVEAARTSSTTRGDGRGVLVAYRHRTERLAGEAYYRRIERAFGIGQQSVGEVDTAKYGLAGEVRVSENLTLRTEAFHAETIEQGGTRDVALLEGRFQAGSLNYHAGLQSARETAVAGEKRSSDLIRAGVGALMLDGKLLLRSDSEFALSGGAGVDDYPSRATFGAEYDVFSDVTVVLEHELGFGDNVDTQDTRFGLRARPWRGHRVESYVGREMTEQGERVFATTGLVQQLHINDDWMVDFGLDRVQTLSGLPRTANQSSFNPAQPPGGGSFDNDFTAAFVGAAFRRDRWDGSARVEFHAGDQTDKWNFLAGAARQLDQGKALSMSAQWLTEQGSDGSVRDSARLRFALAWRPRAEGWLCLSRLDLESEESVDSVFRSTSRKVVENVHINRKWEKHEVSLFAGAKYVVAQFDGDSFDAVTAVVAADYRYDLTPKWDIGAQLGTRMSLESGVSQHSYGVSVGRSVLGNAWISLGYNFSGFTDSDFADADHRTHGAYVKFRLRLDQQMAKRFLNFVGWGREAERDQGLLAGRN